MIWDFIRDFFVQYIFGGITSQDEMYNCSIGGGLMQGDTYYIVGEGGVNLSLGDWLSTTATIIVMCLIVFLLICLVRWIFRAVSSAMLLK